MRLDEVGEDKGHWGVWPVEGSPKQEWMRCSEMEG